MELSKASLPDLDRAFFKADRDLQTLPRGSYDWNQAEARLTEIEAEINTRVSADPCGRLGCREC